MTVTTGGSSDLNDVDIQVLLTDVHGVQGDPNPRMISTTISPAAREVGERNARDDRALLARLIREGVVRRRDGDYERDHPEVARPFVREVEALARPVVNLALRPKSKKRRR